MTSTLTLPQKLFILAIDDEKGTLSYADRSNFGYSLAGAVLAELALRGKIRLEDGRLLMADPIPPGDPALDRAMNLILAEKKPRKLQRWIEKLGGGQTLELIAEQLAARNVIRIEEKRFLWVIPYETYPQVDASAKYWLKQHLRGVVLAGEAAEPADVILLNLLRACDLLRLVFTRDERKAAARKVQEMVKGEVFGEAVAQLIKEIEAAAAAAAVAATAAS